MFSASMSHVLRVCTGFLFVVLSLVTTFPSNADARSTAFNLSEILANPKAQNLVFPFVPNPGQTTGSLCSESDPDFNRLRYGEQIPYCQRNVSRDLKADIYDQYGVPTHCRSEYTIDHFIPLSIGGSNLRSNLWPEHKSIKALRHNLENDLYKRISIGKITQAEAIREVNSAKWNPPVGNPGEFEFCH